MESHTDPRKPMNEVDTTRPWDSLSADEKRLFCRMAEVCAGFLAHADHHIGRLLDYLEETGQLDNTMIVLVSDNGASGEGGPDGSVNENKIFNGVADDIESNLAMLDELGGPKTYNHYPAGDGVGLSASFTKDGEDAPGVASGLLALYHGETKVGEGRIKTQPGKFSIAGEGLCVGRDSGEAVTEDYPGSAPWAFTGGTIRQVDVNVSGKPYVDLEREAVAMMARE